MALVFKDRVRMTTTTTGTGTLALGSAVTGYQAFSAIGDGNTCYFCIEAIDSNGIPTGDWEVSLGTYTTAGTTLSRTTTYASSTGGTVLTLAAGTKHVFCVAHADLIALIGTLDISGLTLADFDQLDSVPFYDLSAASNKKGYVGRLGGAVNPDLCTLRITPTSATPVIATGATSVATIYACHHISGGSFSVSLWDGTRFSVWQVPEIGLSVSCSSGDILDVFLHSGENTPSSTDTGTDVITFGSSHGWTTGGAVFPSETGGGLTYGTSYFCRAVTSTTATLHSTLAGALANTGTVNLTASITAVLYSVCMSSPATWTNATTRATGIEAVRSGGYYRTGDLTKRLIGSYRGSGSNVTELSINTTTAKALISNVHNRVPMILRTHPTTASWTLSSTSFRQANASTANQIELLTSLSQPVTTRLYMPGATGASGYDISVAIGLSGTTPHADSGASYVNVPANYYVPGAIEFSHQAMGYRYYTWLEVAPSGVTVTVQNQNAAGVATSNFLCEAML